MRGMGLQPAQLGRVVAGKPPPRVEPQGRAPSQHTVRVAPNPKTATARKPVKTVK